MRQVTNFKQERKEFVDQYIKPETNNPKIIAAFLKVPREEFVLKEDKNLAYVDSPLPIGEGQTISQPSLVAKMIDNLQLRGGEKVLEIGTGLGYQAAILSQLVKQVYTIERIGSLAKKAAKILAQQNFTNVEVIHGDGTKGLPKEQPFDAVIVAAVADLVPDNLIKQLVEKGRIIIPVQEIPFGQVLKIGDKKNNKVRFRNLGPVAFVPLVSD